MESRAGAVTIVIPTHNRRPFLEEAVASAVAQGPAVARVVVVNDGSEDDTATWLDRLNAPLVTAVHVHPAAGGAAARNRGFDLCRTPYVMFLDDDDVLRQGAIDRLLAALERHPRAAGAAGAGHRFGAPTDRPRTIHPRWPTTRPVWKEVLFCWGMYPAALLWRTAVVADLGGWSEDLRRFEDRDLVLRAYPRPFALIPDTVADLRVHPGQVTNVAHEELDWRLRDAFVARLDPADRRAGAAIVAAARGFEPALESYRRGDPSPLTAVLRRALAPDTTLLRSPILAPWLAGLAVKAGLLPAVPPALARTVREARRSARHRLHQKSTR